MAYQDTYALERLLRLADDDRNEIFVHLDKRWAEVDPRQLAGVCSRSSVVFVPRMNVFWGDFSQIEAALRLFRAAMPGRFDYYHMLSGADLPLKTQDEIHDFFNGHAGKEFVGFAQTPFDRRWVTELHFFNRFMRPTNRVQRAIRNRGTENIVRLQRRLGYDHSRHFGLELRKGSDWFSITHGMALHLMANERVLRRLLRFGHVPTEVYMQTLAWNSDFRDALFDTDDEYVGSARLIDWDRGAPYVFRDSDFDELISSDRMFARKFLSAVDPDVIDRLFEYIVGRTDT